MVLKCVTTGTSAAGNNINSNRSKSHPGTFWRDKPYTTTDVLQTLRGRREGGREGGREAKPSQAASRDAQQSLASFTSECRGILIVN